MVVKIAITGTLQGMTRNEAVMLIEEQTDAVFAPKVKLDTDYLVATRFDTVKARKAADNGVAVISQQEMMDFIDRGEFPETTAFEEPMEWVRLPLDEQVIALLDYVDEDGVITEQRLVKLHSRAISPHGIEYLRALHGPNFRTYRVDRILNLTKFE